VENASVPGLEHFSREELLRLLSWQAITSHPVRYFRIGVGNTLRLLLDAPWRLGLAKGDFNPLARNSMLPPLLPSLPRLEYGLRLVHRGSLAVWPLFTYGVLTAWAAGALVHRWSRLRRGQEPRRSITDSLSSERSQDLADSLGGFLAFGVVASLWLTCQIEAPLDRYQLPYLPMLAMLMSISFARWIHFARPGTRT
jgi:hypothetical protein